MPATAAPARPQGVIVVSAAASLTDVLPVIAAGFEKRYPGTSVRFNFGGSPQLVEQVNAGAPVDVLATASEASMATRQDAATHAQVNTSLLALNRLTVKPVTLELDVRSVLGKVMADEVDAGIVYVTDVRAAGRKVTSIVIPASQNISTTYPIAIVVSAPNPVGAAAFASYVRYTTSAQETLRAYGFAKPW